jgi:hypothetical protein
VEEGRRLSCWSEVVVAVVRHWTVTVGNGATCSGKHITRVHEARQGEEDEANDRALGLGLPYTPSRLPSRARAEAARSCRRRGPARGLHAVTSLLRMVYGKNARRSVRGKERSIVTIPRRPYTGASRCRHVGVRTRMRTRAPTNAESATSLVRSNFKKSQLT